MLYDTRWDQSLFLSAATLEITEVERTALIKVLGMMERGEITSEVQYKSRTQRRLYMPDFIQTNNECETAACLAGWAHIIEPEAFPEVPIIMDYRHSVKAVMAKSRLMIRLSDEAKSLFRFGANAYSVSEPSVAEVAPILRNFLTTGKCQ
jgi:hypothetical protein